MSMVTATQLFRGSVVSDILNLVLRLLINNRVESPRRF